jgi:hypothetical protein
MGCGGNSQHIEKVELTTKDPTAAEVAQAAEAIEG